MAAHTQSVTELSDPYDDPKTSLVNLEAAVRSNSLAKQTNLILRGPKLTEIGPERFFFGSQLFCIILATAWWFLGLIPDIEATHTLAWSWVGFVFARNYVLMFATYGLYHYLFYESAFGKRSHKFNPRLPDAAQHSRDRFWTAVSMTWASCYEVAALYGWANGWFPAVNFSLTAQPIYVFLGLCFGSALFNDLHFYLVHRAIHIGPIYRVVHKHHHLSKNPGPWSGMSMHPIEGILYISRAVFPLFLPHHPVHFYFSMLNTVMMPVPGHSGFEELLGSEYHWLHHHLFTVNYGSPAVPLDWLFGTQAHIDVEKMEAAAAGLKSPVATAALGSKKAQ